MIILGQEVADKVTGYKGIAVCRHSYLNGCDRISVQAKVGKDGAIGEAQVFDEPDLKVVGDGVMPKPKKNTKDKETPGGPHMHRLELR